jgi:hypothetical protein
MNPKWKKLFGEPRVCISASTRVVGCVIWNIAQCKPGHGRTLVGFPDLVLLWHKPTERLNDEPMACRTAFLTYLFGRLQNDGLFEQCRAVT